ncbi:MAG: type II secretion system protein [Paraclostridium sp.]
MNKKRSGFFILENIIALSILGLTSSIVISVFSTSIISIKNSKNKIEMLNIAKTEIDSLKHGIHENKEQILNNNIKEQEIYEIETDIYQKEDYYNCYKITVRVKTKKEEIKLESYMVKN